MPRCCCCCCPRVSERYQHRGELLEDLKEADPAAAKGMYVRQLAHSCSCQSVLALLVIAVYVISVCVPHKT